MSFALDLLEVFIIGVGTPLSAACVIPLYPGFVAYLANTGGAASATAQSGTGRVGEDGPSPVVLGLLVVAGVIAFMGLVGTVFSLLLETSLTRVVEAVSPLAFGALVVLGLLLLADVSVFGRVPTVDPPQFRYPSATAFGYGFFFGAVILPCNPGFVALFFARVPVLFETQLQSMVGFLAFGLGIGAPLLGIAVVSESFGRRLTRALARRKSLINRVTGAILLVVAFYYLVAVFGVFGVSI